ncbi:MAG: PEP-CTERM sorting domain-containing protein [Rubrivivax sp.]|nr:MAG: PEP-CTERM sorting domain-containing protein [Rubrivivax sp.]
MTSAIPSRPLFGEESSMKKSLISLALAMGAIAAQASPVYVGSYRVDDGPQWGGNPTAYSATAAAALLFGGVAADYDISTTGSDASMIDHLGWYTIWGISGGTQFNEDYSFSSCGGGYNCGSANSAVSAYTTDNATGAQYTNYVFRVAANTVPEPATLSIVALGLLGAAAARRRNRA